MRMRIKRGKVTLLLVSILFCFFSCGNPSSSISDSQQGYEEEKQEEKMQVYDSEMYIDSAIELFTTEAAKRENVMVSPFSIMSAMAMTGTGAANNTKEQIEEALFSGCSMEEVAASYQEWNRQLPTSNATQFHNANGIWYKQTPNFVVNQEFIDTCEKIYQAAIRAGNFDENTLQEMNQWIADQTNQMIEDMISSMDADAVMYVINALAFEGEWETPYDMMDVQKQDFYKEDNSIKTVDMMMGQEHLYMEDDTTTGFIKPYKDGYSFVALLPKEGMDMRSYVSSLTKEKWMQLYEGAYEQQVHTGLPKFSSDYDTMLNDTMISLGILDAFDYKKADFSAMGDGMDGNLYIGRILHKTHIDVDEMGTKAAASTVVEMLMESAYFEEDEIKEVILDRPFVYAIVENTTKLPIFIGAMEG